MASKYPDDSGDFALEGPASEDEEAGSTPGKSGWPGRSLNAELNTRRTAREPSGDIFTFDHTPGRARSGSRLTDSPPNSPLFGRARPQSPRTPAGRRKPDTEDNVVRQTEDVFRSFMRQRYTLDQIDDSERIDVATPSVPELMVSTSGPLSSTSDVGRQLAQIGDEIDARYGAEFTKLLSVLRITPDTAYEAFAGVCRKLFADNTVNWGRIVTLLQFGYRMAIEYIKHGLPEFLRKIVSYLVQFIATEKVVNTVRSIASWIAEQGGWTAAVSQGLSQLGASVTHLAVILGICATVLAVAYFKR